MPHLLKEYSKNLGVEPTNIFVNEHFFPICSNNYIVFYNEQKVTSKSYRYYSLVIDILRPTLLKNNIDIVFIGSNDNVSNRSDYCYPNLSFKKNAYIISKSKLFISIDNALTQYAGCVGVPVVNLYGNIYPSITTSFWLDENKKIDIEPDWSCKPSMSLSDPEDSINKIPAEKIAGSILKMLNLGSTKNINFKTKLINKIHENCVDVIPTKYIDLPIFKNNTLNIRLDLGVNVDEKSFYQYCFNHKCNLILEDSFIQIESIKNIAHNIDSIYLKLNSIPEKVSDKYFSILKRLGINFHFLVKNKSILEDVKFKYFDQNVDYLDSYKQMPNSVSLKDRFFSFKFVVEGDSVYSCLHHWKNNIDNNDNIVDNADYWEELDYFYIYEQDRT